MGWYYRSRGCRTASATSRLVSEERIAQPVIWVFSSNGDVRPTGVKLLEANSYSVGPSMRLVRSAKPTLLGSDCGVGRSDRAVRMSGHFLK